MDDGRIEISTGEARQASREGVVRYVLAISTALVVIVFLVLYFIYF